MWQSFYSTLTKFNPYHGHGGLFANANGAKTFSAKPGQLKNPEKAQRAMGGNGGNSSTESHNDKVHTRGHISQKDYFGDIKTEKEAVEVIRSDLSKSSGEKITTKQAQDMYDAIYTYSGSKYKDIRAAQTGENKSAADIKMGKQIDAFIEKSPKWDGGEVYRGMSLNDGQKTLKKGATIDMQGTSSWSSKKEIANNYVRGDGNGYIFVLPKTKQGTSVEHLSNFPGENEVLISSKATFQINDIKTEKKRGKKPVTYVYLEEV